MAGLADFTRDAYDLFFQVSPITLLGGSAGNIAGGMLPIIATIGGLGGVAQGFLSGLINGGEIGMQDFPWRFVPVPGATAIIQTAATYPFANKRIAANATIEQPKTVSLRMIWPVNQTAGMMSKLALFSSLQAALEQHNRAGGTYSVATPAMLYDHCILLSLTDVTPDSSKQKQIEWQWDFLKPLITQTEAAGALSGLMNLLNGGGVTSSSSWSGAFTNGIAGDVGAAVSGISGAVSSVGSFVGQAL